jgi:predicted DNA-binding transcriptional regulator YafY
MPVNRNALIRYRTIDKCLQNRRRKWTIDDLIEACSEALCAYEGVDKGISLRTIRMDLNAMRSDKLGYNAPIIVTDRKFYSYEDAGYSIANIPLTQQDLSLLQEVSSLLQQFKGFNHFSEVTEMVNKLDDKIYSEKYRQPSVIDFEKNDLLEGLKWLDALHKATVQQRTLLLTYQSFKARTAADILFFPYLLKEYRNRWFVLGMTKKHKEICTLALDRILEVQLSKEPYRLHRGFDPQTYFSQIVGVTRNAGDAPIAVHFFADRYQASYIRTKPLHSSQQVIANRDGGTEFSITVIPNFELEREFLGFGEGVRVLSPGGFARRIQRRIKLMYAAHFNGPTAG